MLYGEYMCLQFVSSIRHQGSVLDDEDAAELEDNGCEKNSEEGKKLFECPCCKKKTYLNPKGYKTIHCLNSGKRMVRLEAVGESWASWKLK